MCVFLRLHRFALHKEFLVRKQMCQTTSGTSASSPKTVVLHYVGLLPKLPPRNLPSTPHQKLLFCIMWACYQSCHHGIRRQLLTKNCCFALCGLASKAATTESAVNSSPKTVVLHYVGLLPQTVRKYPIAQKESCIISASTCW